MQVSHLIERAAGITWRRRVLWALGVLLIVLTRSGLFARAVTGLALEVLLKLPPFHPISAFPVPPPLISLGQLGEAYRLVDSWGAPGWAGFIGGSAILLIAIGVLGIVTLGGLIAAGADDTSISFMAAIQAGWRRVWPMVVIASIPAIPPTLAAIVIVVMVWGGVSASGGVGALGEGRLPDSLLTALGAMSSALGCLSLIMAIPLQWLSGLAYRACILEQRGAIDSFRRAWFVLRANFRAAAVIAALSVGIELGTGTLVSLPLNLSTIFLPAIVIVWAINGLARVFILELWTLAWQEWTRGEPPA